ncbi:hypothetical protein GCM10010433_32510 [Streptomyces pulveraceus]|uniref:Uncharacterized protein n=1 Tax=Streptomyces pulveraceus TaxID=68258 RepID=A0ABW1GSH9_9ACTN
MLVFVYLNPDSGAVQVSVDLETAEIVRPDGTVPLRVAVQDTVLLDGTQPDATASQHAETAG